MRSRSKFTHEREADVGLATREREIVARAGAVRTREDVPIERAVGGAGRMAVIVSPDRDLSPALPDGTETVVQPVADGTGGAMRAAIEFIRDADTVVVLSGDRPLISPRGDLASSP